MYGTRAAGLDDECMHESKVCLTGGSNGRPVRRRRRTADCRGTQTRLRRGSGTAGRGHVKTQDSSTPQHAATAIHESTDRQRPVRLVGVGPRRTQLVIVLSAARLSTLLLPPLARKRSDVHSTVIDRRGVAVKWLLPHMPNLACILLTTKYLRALLLIILLHPNYRARAWTAI